MKVRHCKFSNQPGCVTRTFWFLTGAIAACLWVAIMILAAVLIPPLVNDISHPVPSPGVHHPRLDVDSAIRRI